MKLDPGNAQHLGSRRDQQDAFAFSDPSDTAFLSHGGFLAVLADGMGGLSHGASASRVAVKAFQQIYRTKSASESIPDALKRSLDETNAAVREMARRIDAQGSVGTTLVAAAIHESELYWISVGDSGLFLFRDGHLTLLSTAHTYARELEAAAASGQISVTEAREHPDRDSLTSYLGQTTIVDIDRTPQAFPLQANDRILLASDGLFKTLSNGEIASAIRGQSQSSCDELVRRVLGKKQAGQDNVTVMLVALDVNQ